MAAVVIKTTGKASAGGGLMSATHSVVGDRSVRDADGDGGARGWRGCMLGMGEREDDDARIYSTVIEMKLEL